MNKREENEEMNNRVDKGNKKKKGEKSLVCRYVREKVIGKGRVEDIREKINRKIHF